MGWREAGDAWGSRATEWAYLAEPHFRPVNERIFGLTGVKAGTALLDVGCGSGYASWLAADRGAGVHGLDASENLLAVARARTPHGDFQLGDMDSLPWDTESFDVVTCFNSVWIGDDVAMAEAARVLSKP
jgi:ubiquinone/menaquinone biosynthesis C-methylase UbiE